ncbi:MAG: FAD-dependent oxidoreductase [Pontixanthobacter sp.]
MTQDHDASPRIAIIGAGMAGLTCAIALRERGHTATLFDKGRGAGGRMSTRRVTVEDEEITFDHGAQYFTARDPGFVEVVEGWEAKGVAARWPAAGNDAFVGTPGMNGPLKHMAYDMDVRWSTRVEAFARTANAWSLLIGGAEQLYDVVIIAVPAEQAANLLKGAGHSFADIASCSHSAPCWATMASFEARLPITVDCRKEKNARISWAARNSAKPARMDRECWVLHASPDFSREMLDLPKAAVAQKMLSTFFEENACDPRIPTYSDAHRWLYAMAEPSGDQSYLWDAEAGLGVCGDWCVAPRVEGAWQSGNAMARAIVAAPV